MRQFRPLGSVVLGIAVLALSFLAVQQVAAQPASGVGPKAGAVSAGQMRFEEQFFSTDSHQASGKSTVVGGCVYNRTGINAERVRVDVEGLDANDAVVGSTTLWVSTVPAGSYGHFEMPALPGAAKYRSKVIAFDRPQAR